ncbi:TRAP transporter small permease [Sediminicoccus rosea]|uniref:TRAP transporter small permease protein n=1 Tax=Sediminicoccus rosea TaxID=1225128 RepID=A0ABZ0PNX5_9PROT|nr:TRAP transporter small permease [Sediminicoccus rosea]WPB87245.1 TRAP transporter small permease [Sediminicoccus rosea]
MSRPVPPALAIFSRALGALSWVTVALAGVALVVLVGMMGWLVFGRYVLNDTPTWIERVATLAILSIAMPVAAVGVRERFHLSVLGVREALPRATQRWVALGCDVLMGAFGAGMAWWSWELVEMVGPFRIPLLGISQGWTYAPMVAGGLLMVLFAIEQVLLDIFSPEAPEQRGVAAAFLE